MEDGKVGILELLAKINDGVCRSNIDKTKTAIMKKENNLILTTEVVNLLKNNLIIKYKKNTFIYAFTKIIDLYELKKRLIT